MEPSSSRHKGSKSWRFVPTHTDSIRRPFNYWNSIDTINFTRSQPRERNADPVATRHTDPADRCSNGSAPNVSARANNDRRLHEDSIEGGQSAERGTTAEVRKALEASGLARRRAAPNRGRNR